MLTKAQAATDEQIADLTKKRQEEKATNDQTVKDAQDAQTAVERAVTVLREFYAQAGEATALVQRRQLQATSSDGAKRQQPEIFGDTAYTGMGAESGGVVAMLEIIQSDYARLEATTSAMEHTSQASFDRFMSDARVSKATAKTDMEHKNREKQSTEQSVMDSTNDLSSAQKELSAANNYYEKLRPSCLNTGLGYEEKIARRKEEITSLKEALQILGGESGTALYSSGTSVARHAEVEPCCRQGTRGMVANHAALDRNGCGSRGGLRSAQQDALQRNTG